MDYEQMYKDALERAKDGKPIDEIFPELNKNEDERIRKALIEYFQVDGCLCSNIPTKDVRAWLKKQGKLVDSLSKGLDNAHERIDGLIQKNNSLIEQLEKKQGDQNQMETQDAQTIKEALRTEYEKGRADAIAEMQKPAEWSEEDEIALGDALWAIRQATTIAKDENDMGNLWYAEKWLKSLKPQPHWKPSIV